MASWFCTDLSREELSVSWTQANAFTQAIELAQSIEHPHSQVLALKEIAKQLPRAGGNEQASELLE
ncbi:MAG: hypothetical protein N3B10_03370 [Armatimonadetes bacterium]|nr:hypothetical protein [Armatimonadota bacterium]MCX7967513.1 hypothetical protein [Armatimonadota bacterium]MDW8142471.1 hypothetical protein [Armatimonadota bacterium]